jgi:hypothetical protein
MNKMSVAAHIGRWAIEAVFVSDRTRVIEMVETGLQCLHEGNMDRFRIRLAEFALWQDGWK